MSYCTIDLGPWLNKNYKIILLKIILNQDKLERNPVDDGVIKDQRSLKEFEKYLFHLKFNLLPGDLQSDNYTGETMQGEGGGGLVTHTHLSN